MVHETQTSIESKMMTHFSEQFSRKYHDNSARMEFVNLVPEMFNEEDNNILEQPIIDNDISEEPCLFMKQKILGPDSWGIEIFFYVK